MNSLKIKLKNGLRPYLINSFAWDLQRRRQNERDLRTWEEAGHPAPPPHIAKQQVLAAYASAFGPDTLIETGTYLGDMVYAMKTRFGRIISIELDETLHCRAVRRFRAYPQVEIRHGDSGEELSDIVSNLSAPCLFWLDGHYSAGNTARGRLDTPIMKELTIIFGGRIKEHVILIDDARCFDGTGDYPKIDALREFVEQNATGHEFCVRSDVIRISPRRSDCPRIVI